MTADLVRVLVRISSLFAVLKSVFPVFFHNLYISIEEGRTWMVHDTNNTGLAGNGLGAPREVAGIKAEGTELAVATTSADQVDTLGADTGVRWLSATDVSHTRSLIGRKGKNWENNSPALLKGTS
jgi:hypothetical protein